MNWTLDDVRDLYQYEYTAIVEYLSEEAREANHRRRA